ncbi:MAG: Tfp pilus assembly protein FimT/FimU [Vicinamibacteria bacterium]
MSGRERGYALIALLATTTIMLLLMGAAAPSWRYVMKNEREEELIFRGRQISEAIRRYQAKNANALPVSLDVLVKGRFLRQAFKDPMTKDGEWRLIRQGEPLLPPGSPGSGRPGAPSASPTPSPAPTPRTAFGPVGPGVGAIVGVASRSAEKGLRLVNGRERYNEWLFVAGQPIMVGRQVIGGPPGGPQRPGQTIRRPGT